MNELEKKIRAKVENMMIWAYSKDMSLDSNKKTFIDNTTKSMLKILKAEVNIQIQNIKHGRS